MELREMQCTPISKDEESLTETEIRKYKNQLSIGWKIVEGKILRKEFPFENFRRGVRFVDDVAIIADNEDHHPDICLHYSSVEVELSTHDIGGLSMNDFIMAAKIDEL